MYHQNIVAFFPTISDAEKARERLIGAGIERSAIRLSNESASSSSSATSSGRMPDDHEEGWFEWLFGSNDDVPEYERNWYGENLANGRAALSVRLASAEEISRVEQLLEAEGALDVDRDDDAMAGGMQSGYAASGSTASASRSTAEDEEVIPVVKEELAVGKRAHETRRRIRTHVIERPVQEQVQLQDETVIVERRPVTGAKTAQPGDLTEREFEVIERHEEPVVEKRAGATEEVVVKKDVKSRTETVADKVRETQVEVEGETVPGTRGGQR
jgi:stress response protein YsnF